MPTGLNKAVTGIDIHIMVARADGTQGWVHAGYIQSSAPISTLPTINLYPCYAKLNSPPPRV